MPTNGEGAERTTLRLGHTPPSALHKSVCMHYQRQPARLTMPYDRGHFELSLLFFFYSFILHIIIIKFIVSSRGIEPGA